MSLQQTEIQIKEIELELAKLNELEKQGVQITQSRQELLAKKEQLYQSSYQNLSAYDRVYLARHPDRPNVEAYIQAIFDQWIELHGDRLYRDDPAIIGGLATLNGQAVTVIGTRKGKTVEANIACNFGMANPEGYRKAIRLMKQAEKFHRPIITFIDTPGAYPGLEAEKHGQGEAIARAIMEMSQLAVPTIAFVIGEGGSGGALALSTADRIVMLENAVYSVLSPEGFASILFKDSSKAREVSELMKLTAQDLADLNIIDAMIKEPLGGVQNHPDFVYLQIRQYLEKELPILLRQKKSQLKAERYQKYREIGHDA